MTDTPRPPTTRNLSLLDLVLKAWGEQFYMPDTAYEFSNGRKFESTDRSDHGLYNGGAE